MRFSGGIKVGGIGWEREMDWLKSIIFTIGMLFVVVLVLEVPSGHISSTFSDDNARCAIPLLCQYSTAPKICLIISTRTSKPTPPFFYLSPNSTRLPGISSITIYKYLLSKKYSIICTIFGWSNFLRISTSLRISWYYWFPKGIILQIRDILLLFRIILRTILKLLRLIIVENW